MTGNDAFEMKSGTGWNRGLDNMLRSGLSRWFKTRTWWVHCLIWSIVMVALVGGLAFSRPETAPLSVIVMIYTEAAGLLLAVGVVIAMQDALVSEKREGTAAWVLSKPATRTAFVLSRLVINGLAIVLTSVVVPGLLVYVTLGALTDIGWLSPFKYFTPFELVMGDPLPVENLMVLGAIALTGFTVAYSTISHRDISR